MLKFCIHILYNSDRHKRDRFERLSKSICDLFPGVYDLEDWYRPSKSNDHATGFLINAFDHLKTLAVKIGMYEGQIRKAPTKDSNESNTFKIHFLI